MTDLFGNDAESFLFSVRKLCEEQVNKSDKLSLRVLTFLEDRIDAVCAGGYNFLSWRYQDSNKQLRGKGQQDSYTCGDH